MRWIVQPTDDVREQMRPLLSHLASCAGGWPPAPRDDWYGWSCVKFGPQSFVFHKRLGAECYYMKWLPRIILTKRRRGFFFWPTPARQHARWTERSRELGIDVATLSAAAEMLRSILDPRMAPSFIITSSPDGWRTVRDRLLDDTLTDDQRKRIAEKVEDAATKLHSAKICRVDLRAANLLTDPDATRVQVFDFDSYRYDPNPFPSAIRRHREKDLEKVRRTVRILLGQEPVPDKWKAQRSRNASVSQT